MTNLSDENRSPEIENVADDFEEMEKINFSSLEVGDHVEIVDATPCEVALFGRGYHEVTDFRDEQIVIKLWHGKRSITLNQDRLKKVDWDDTVVF